MKPLLMCHRGIPWNLAENSLASFRAGLETGCEIIEFDVRLSKDGIPMIMHDETIDRTTSGSGAVAQLDYKQLRSHFITFTKSGPAHPGEIIPTLDETLDLLTHFPSVVINCELKDYRDECLQQVLKAFTCRGMLGRTVFTCFDFSVLMRLKKIESSVKVQGFPLELMNSVPAGCVDCERFFDYIGIKYSLATKELVARYRSMGLVIGLWVVNELEQWKRCLELEVDIVTTDRVDWLMDVRENVTRVEQTRSQA